MNKRCVCMNKVNIILGNIGGACGYLSIVLANKDPVKASIFGIIAGVIFNYMYIKTIKKYEGLFSMFNNRDRDKLIDELDEVLE